MGIYRNIFIDLFYTLHDQPLGNPTLAQEEFIDSLVWRVYNRY
ncbi:hypothetical protein Sphch_3067 [Sphingobium chlorophenolicum L-1]|uniref:Uncharacterized protein n=1 Tax=Sphingobium chlorophenolicum L-1 TaxID=690566 RepID=F6F2M5_SPHCR|nr:hypothetical protein Sphch_3067 [Sphingobium chlorophenolicum L-1]